MNNNQNDSATKTSQEREGNRLAVISRHPYKQYGIGVYEQVNSHQCF